MLWNVARDGSTKKIAVPAKNRLHIYVCQTDYVDESSVVEILFLPGKGSEL